MTRGASRQSQGRMVVSYTAIVSRLPFEQWQEWNLKPATKENYQAVYNMVFGVPHECECTPVTNPCQACKRSMAARKTEEIPF